MINAMFVNWFFMLCGTCGAARCLVCKSLNSMGPTPIPTRTSSPTSARGSSRRNLRVRRLPLSACHEPDTHDNPRRLVRRLDRHARGALFLARTLARLSVRDARVHTCKRVLYTDRQITLHRASDHRTHASATEGLYNEVRWDEMSDMNVPRVCGRRRSITAAAGGGRRFDVRQWQKPVTDRASSGSRSTTLKSSFERRTRVDYTHGRLHDALRHHTASSTAGLPVRNCSDRFIESRPRWWRRHSRTGRPGRRRRRTTTSQRRRPTCRGIDSCWRSRTLSSSSSRRSSSCRWSSPILRRYDCDNWFHIAEQVRVAHRRMSCSAACPIPCERTL